MDALLVERFDTLDKAGDLLLCGRTVQVKCEGRLVNTTVVRNDDALTCRCGWLDIFLSRSSENFHLFLI